MHSKEPCSSINPTKCDHCWAVSTPTFSVMSVREHVSRVEKPSFLLSTQYSRLWVLSWLLLKNPPVPLCSALDENMMCILTSKAPPCSGRNTAAVLQLFLAHTLWSVNHYLFLVCDSIAGWTYSVLTVLTFGSQPLLKTQIWVCKIPPNLIKCALKRL